MPEFKEMHGYLDKYPKIDRSEVIRERVILRKKIRMLRNAPICDRSKNATLGYPEISVTCERDRRQRATMEGENQEGRGWKTESTRDRGKEEQGSRYRTYGLRSH
jgi:hypothetical protein